MEQWPRVCVADAQRDRRLLEKTGPPQQVNNQAPHRTNPNCVTQPYPLPTRPRQLLHFTILFHCSGTAGVSPRSESFASSFSPAILLLTPPTLPLLTRLFSVLLQAVGLLLTLALVALATVAFHSSFATESLLGPTVAEPIPLQGALHVIRYFTVKSRDLQNKRTRPLPRPV